MGSEVSERFALFKQQVTPQVSDGVWTPAAKLQAYNATPEKLIQFTRNLCAAFVRYFAFIFFFKRKPITALAEHSTFKRPSWISLHLLKI